MPEFAFLLLLAVCGAVPIAGLMLARYREADRWSHDLVAYALRFPQGLDPATVTTFITGLSALFTPRSRKPWAMRGVMFEASATQAGIEHHLLVARSDAQIVLIALRAALPSVVVAPDETYRPLRPSVATELGLSTAARPLTIDNPAAISAHLLASLQPLGAGEVLRVQWSARPIGPQRLVTPATKRSSKSTALEQL